MSNKIDETPRQIKNIAISLSIMNFLKEIWILYWLVSVMCLIFATTSVQLQTELVACYMAACMYVFLKGIAYVYLIEKRDFINLASQWIAQLGIPSSPITISPVGQWLFYVGCRLALFVILPSIIFLTS